MRMKPYLGLTLAILFVCATYPVLAQTAPTATKYNPQFAIGAGVSGFNPDWGHGIIMGETVWIDYSPTRVPLLLKGIGLEVELRDLNFDRTKTVPPLMVQQTAGGGVTYTWRRFNNIRPYGKFLEEFGGLTWGPSGPGYHHDTRTVTIGGVGLEYRAWRNVWLRADYEYQFWPDLFGDKTLDPKGFTLGAMYHFNSSHFH